MLQDPLTSSRLNPMPSPPWFRALAHLVGLVLVFASCAPTRSAQQRDTADSTDRTNAGQERPEEVPTKNSRFPGWGRTEGGGPGAKSEDPSNSRLIARECHPDAKDCTPTSPPPKSLASEAEKVDWQKGLEWWPYRPLLQSIWLPREGYEEVLYAASEKGGTKGSCTSRCNLMVLYQYPPATAETHSHFQLIESGSWDVHSIHYLAGDSVPFAGGAGTKPVTVRGRLARMLTMYKGENSNVDWRSVRWEDPLANGDFILWTVSNSPRLYTEDQTIEFIDRLIERR